MPNDIQKSGFQVYLPKDGEYRAFFCVDSPRLTRTVLLPVSTHRMARRLAARLFAEFRQTQIVSRRVPMEIQRMVLWKLLYDYVGQLLDDLSRKWPTVRGYKCNLKQLFQECRWRYLSDITPESFLRWRDSSSRGDYQHNRFLREVNAFLDEMTVIGVAPANPLRKIEAMSHLVAESRRVSRLDMIALTANCDQFSAGNDLKLIVGGSTEKAADPSQGSGILKHSGGWPLHQTDNACAAALVAFAQPRIP